MIYILHGDDVEASYNRLQIILKKYPNFHKVRLTAEHTFQDYYMAAFAKDLLEEQKLIICEDFISSKKIKEKDLEKIPGDQTVIFWEKNKIRIKKSSGQNRDIQEFKPRASIYYFLDSISPQNIKKTLTLLSSLDESSGNLTWHLSQRTLLLIFAKKGFARDLAANVLQKQLEEWQWQKITSQAAQFSKEALLGLFNDLLKLDYLKKQGKTESPDKTLVSVLLIKYFPPPQMLE